MWQWDFRGLLTPDQLQSGVRRHITGCRLNLYQYKIFKTCWEAVKHRWLASAECCPVCTIQQVAIKTALNWSVSDIDLQVVPENWFTRYYGRTLTFMGPYGRDLRGSYNADNYCPSCIHLSPFLPLSGMDPLLEDKSFPACDWNVITGD